MEWNSHRSLLEFDIIVVEPTLRDLYAFENYNGTPLFSKERSLSVRDSVSNWKSQIKTAYEEGKTIIVSLTERESYFYYTGEVAWSGSGRNSRQTNSISPISNFDMLPSLFVPSQKTVGFKTVPVADDGEFKDRWRSIEDTLQYQFFFTAPNAMPLAVIRGTENLVSAMIPGPRGGAIFLVPPPLIDFEKWQDEDEEWNDQGLLAGRKFLNFFLFLKEFGSQRQGVEVLPEWVFDSGLRLPDEKRREIEIRDISEKIADLEAQKTTAQSALAEYVSPKALLYSKGPKLELAVRAALTELGYRAENFAEGDLEFDAMFSVGGKRCLGEVEGKDAKPIDVAKISQLSRCLNEDFDRAEISEFAKGILFGNPFRMTPLAERPEGFTNKVVIAAERSAISLVYTYQIFDVLRRARATASLDEASAFMSALVDHPGGLFLWPPMDTN